MAKRRNKLSRPRFNLNYTKDQLKKQKQLIFLVYRYKKDGQGQNVMLKYSTGEFVDKRFWDSKLQRIKLSLRNGAPQSKEVNRINKKLDELRGFCIEYIQGKPDAQLDEFKLELDYLTQKTKRPKDKMDYSLVQYINDKFIPQQRKHKRTIAKYRTAKTHLSNYEEEVLGKPILFSDISPEFSEKFSDWLYSKYNHSQNTVSKVIQNLKEFVSTAHTSGYHSNILYKSRKFGVPRIKTTKHYLKLEEINTLLKANLESNERHDKVRDLWCIAALSGLRYSDFSRLKEKHFIEYEGVRMIKLDTYKGRTVKSDTEVVIPIIPQLSEILNKYNYEPPQAYSSQKMNLYIKEMMKFVGIDRIVKTKKSKGGKMVESEAPLYKSVTNHTARYTFINIMLNDFEIPPRELQKITGQSLKVLLDYEREDKKDNAVKVAARIKELSIPKLSIAK